MDSPITSCSMTSHQAMMKCPWQWRQPFLDEKLESRKRKMGDGYFYDPVDPNFVDHLLPAYAKKLCTDTLEVDEKEKIQQEIERLMLKKEEDHDEFVANAALIYDSLVLLNEQAAGETSATSPPSSPLDSADDDGEACGASASTENQALVDSILLMSKAVADASQASSLLASPLSDSSSSDEEDMDSGDSSCDESAAEELPLDSDTISCTTTSSDGDSTSQDASYSRSPSLELMSDNLQESLISVEDDDLLDFACLTARDRNQNDA